MGTAAALAKVILNRERYTQPKRDPHEIFRPELTFDAYERWYAQLLGERALDAPSPQSIAG